MSDPRQHLGRRAEDEALTHLRAAGLTLVTRNWKAPSRPGLGGHGGELDLVMQDGDVLVFVEVRAATRTSASHGFGGGAAYSVGPVKQRRLAVLAQRFLYTLKERPRAMRFDVVALGRTERGWDLRWYKNAFTVG